MGLAFSHPLPLIVPPGRSTGQIFTQRFLVGKTFFAGQFLVRFLEKKKRATSRAVREKTAERRHWRGRLAAAVLLGTPSYPAAVAAARYRPRRRRRGPPTAGPEWQPPHAQVGQGLCGRGVKSSARQAPLQLRPVSRLGHWAPPLPLQWPPGSCPPSPRVSGVAWRRRRQGLRPPTHSTRMP